MRAGGGTFFEPLSLPVDGTRRFLFAPNAGGVGSLTVQMYSVPSADGRALTVDTRDYRDADPPEVGDLLLRGTSHDRGRFVLRLAIGPPQHCYVLSGDGRIVGNAIEFDVRDPALHLSLPRLATFDNFHGGNSPGTVLDFGLRLCLDQDGQAAAYW